MVEHEQSPTNEELARPALSLARTFIQRWDLYARQLDDGRYICVREPLNADHLLAHLKGEITLGAYVLDQQSYARFIVIDADDDQAAKHLSRLAGGLAEEGIPTYLEDSRRGSHLWLFFAQPIAGKDARSFGEGLLAAHGIKDVELFPKQDRLADGPGSLIRLPFGVHRLSGQRYGFITVSGELLAATIRQQIAQLAAPEIVSEEMLDSYRPHVSFRPLRAVIAPSKDPPDDNLEKIKSDITVLEFVSQYVDVKPTASGGIGLCPFHDDHHPSFAVNDQGNYWNCFAGCGGGSIVDFWMKWRDTDFATAVGELTEMMLR